MRGKGRKGTPAVRQGSLVAEKVLGYIRMWSETGRGSQAEEYRVQAVCTRRWGHGNSWLVDIPPWLEYTSNRPPHITFRRRQLQFVYPGLQVVLKNFRRYECKSGDVADQWDTVGFPGAHITTAYVPSRSIQVAKEQHSGAIGAIHTEQATEAYGGSGVIASNFRTPHSSRLPTPVNVE